MEKYGHAEPGREDHDPALLEVADRAQRHERLGDLASSRSPTAPASGTWIFSRASCSASAFMIGGQHPHVVGAVAVDARAPGGRARCCPPPTTTAGWMPMSTTSASCRATSAVAASEIPEPRGGGERLAGELEQDPVVGGSCVAVSHACRAPPSRGARRAPSVRRQLTPPSSPSLNRANRRTWTFSPVLALTSSRYCWIVLLSSFTNGWSSSTLSLRNASILPSTILGTMLSGLPAPSPAPRRSSARTRAPRSARRRG